MKKLMLILTVTAFAVAAHAGGDACAAKATADAKACSAKSATSCSAGKTACCGKEGAKTVSVKVLKSPRHESQS